MAPEPASTVSTPQPRGEANIAKTTPTASTTRARMERVTARVASWQPWRLISVQQPRPTLGDLQRATPWVWVWCENCQHSAPLACAVAVIRWGTEHFE